MIQLCTIVDIVLRTVESCAVYSGWKRLHWVLRSNRRCKR